MRCFFLVGIFTLGCPSAPRVMIDGTALEASSATGTDTGVSDDENDDDDGDDDGGDNDGGDDDGGDDDGGDDDGGDDDDTISFLGAYDGVIGREVLTGGEPCTENTTLYVDQDNTFTIVGICALGWGSEYQLTVVGAFDQEGSASGTFTTETLGGREESGTLEGYIDEGTIELNAEITLGWEEVNAFFYTE